MAEIMTYSELARAAVTAMIDDDRILAAKIVTGEGMEAPDDVLMHARALALTCSKLSAELLKLSALDRGVDVEDVWQQICSGSL